MLDLLTLAMNGLVVILLLRIARALELLVSPTESDSAPFDYHTVDKKHAKHRRSNLYTANRDLHLPK